MTQLFAQTSSGIPPGAETVYRPGQTAIDGNTPFNPGIAVILLLIAGGALAYLLRPQQR